MKLVIVLLLALCCWPTSSSRYDEEDDRFNDRCLYEACFSHEIMGFPLGICLGERSCGIALMEETVDSQRVYAKCYWRTGWVGLFCSPMC